jgi:predicted CxxxxCH...CXXCH cytochrome family protein
MVKPNGRTLTSVTIGQLFRASVSFFISLIIIGVFCVPILANDPPHNDDSGVPCGECHAEELFAGDPGLLTPAELRELYNTVCLRCHWETSGTYHANAGPRVDAHSSAVIQGNYTFTTSCIDCHHPHYQTEQFWYGRKYYGAEWRLARGSGVLGGTESDPITGALLTVINYTGLTAKADSEWETDPATLATKTGTGRGAMFLPNYNSPYNSRIIVSMTASESSPGVWQGTIKVKGPVVEIATGGFAIAYGQLINRNIPFSAANAEPVLFLDRHGNMSFAHNDTPGGDDTTPNGICQVCHTQTNHWRNDGSLSAVGIHSGMDAGVNCISCHSHLDGFKASCDACHGFPPGDLVSNPGPTGSTTSGAHTEHTDNKGYGCAVCHYESAGSGPTHNNGLKVTMGFYLFNGIYQGGSYNGQVGVGYDNTSTNPVTTVSDPGTGAKTCSNLYCHGILPNGSNWGGGTDTNPVWDGSVACGDCHRATAATPPTSGQHQKHAAAFTAGYNYDCGFCHMDPEVDDSLHGNNMSEVVFSTDPMVVGGVYNGDSDMLGSYGSCTNIYCHSTAQSSPPGGSPEYRTTPAWTSRFSGCDKCHYTWGSNPGLTTGSHDPHFFNDEGQQCYGCHNWEGNDDPCFACHRSGDFFTLREFHANYEINVLFSPKYGGTYSGSLTPGDSYGSCANTYCHSDGTSLATGTIPGNNSPAWGSTGQLPCDSCHDNGPGYDLYDPKANSHGQHTQFGCEICHYDTTTDGLTITNRANHANMLYDVVRAPSYTQPDETVVPLTFTYVFDAGGGSCSNINCHTVIAEIDSEMNWGNASLTPSAFSYDYTNQGNYGVTLTVGAPDCQPDTYPGSTICPSPYTYNWEFSDGHTESTTSNSIHHEFGTPGPHTATLTQEAANGLSGIRVSEPINPLPPPSP